MDEILNPNCSEVVWRLDVKKSTREEILKSLKPKDEDYDYETFTTGDEYPNGCVSDMVMELEGAVDVDKAKIIYEESQGNKGVEEYTEECFKIAKRFKRGEIDNKEAKELEKKVWEEEVEKYNDENEDY